MNRLTRLFPAMASRLPSLRNLPFLTRIAGPAAADGARAHPTGEVQAGPADAARRRPSASRIPPDADLMLESRNVLRAGRRKVAVNLLWQMRDESHGIADQARALASRTGADYLFQAFFHGGRQIAFIDGQGGVEAGMPAAVSMVDPDLAQSWIGAFEVSPTHYWVVSVRDGAVLLDLVDERDAALQEFHSQVEGAQWQSVFAPPEWLDHAETDQPPSAASLLSGAGIPVRHISLWRAWWKRGLLAIVLLAAVAGGLQTWSWWQDEQRDAEIARERALQEQRRLAGLQPPWSLGADPVSFFAQCRDAIATMVFDAPGWEQEPVECIFQENGKAVVRTSWKRQLGQVHMLRMMRPVRYRDTPLTLEGNGDRAVMEEPLDVGMQGLPAANKPAGSGGSRIPAGDRDRSQDGPWTSAQVEQRLLERYQALGLTIRLSNRDPSRGATTRKGAGSVVFGYHEIGFSSTAGMDEHVSLLSDVPAAIGQSLSYDKGTGTFEFVARVYHPPLLPTQIAR